MEMVYASLCVVSLVFSGQQYVVKTAMTGHLMPPLVLALCRCFFGSTIMFSVQALGLDRSCFKSDLTDAKSAWPALGCRDALTFFTLGVLQAANVCGNILAVSRLSAFTVTIFQPLIPLCAGAIACFCNIEYVSVPQTLGLLLAAIGAVSVVALADHGAAASSDQFLDDGAAWQHGGPFLALNIISSAMYVVLHKRPCSIYPPILVPASSFLIASLPICLILVVSGSLHDIHWSVFTTAPALCVICYATVLTTALNYSLIAWATRETSPTTVTSFETLQPLFAALLLWFFYGNLPSKSQAVGALLIATGLFVFTKAGNNEDAIVRSRLLQDGHAASAGFGTACSSTERA